MVTGVVICEKEINLARRANYLKNKKKIVLEKYKKISKKIRIPLSFPLSLTHSLLSNILKVGKIVTLIH